MLSEIQTLNQRIADLQAERDQLLAELFTDPLTGIGNRRAYDRRLASRNGRESYVVIDVNLFKQINDTLGHDAGDRVLQVIADCIRGETDACYRTGGDEFVLVLDMPAAATVALVQRIAQAVGSLQAGPHRLSISFGIGQTFQEADQRMYLMKQLSRKAA